MTAPPVAGTGLRRSWTAAIGLAGRSRGVRALTAVVVSVAVLVAAGGALLVALPGLVEGLDEIVIEIVRLGVDQAVVLRELGY